jgi:hypothetical protein
MAAPNPPIIDTHALPSTPAHEWANETTTALKSNPTPDPLVVSNPNSAAEALSTIPPASKRPAFVANPSTPGNELPGAYPRSSAAEVAPDALPTVGEAKDTAFGVVESARAYLPAQQDVTNALEAAKGYLPQAIQGYFRQLFPVDS